MESILRILSFRQEGNPHTVTRKVWSRKEVVKERGSDERVGYARLRLEGKCKVMGPLVL